MEGYIGEIRNFAGNFAPMSWAFCDGQLMSIAENTALFSIVGTMYGGDGQTTFGLPDFRSRVSLGVGNGPGLPPITLGEVGGQSETILTVANLPPHKHNARVNVSTAPGDEPTSTRVIANQTGAFNEGATTGKFLRGVAENNVGSSASFSNMQPNLAVNYIICLYGIYPSRN